MMTISSLVFADGLREALGTGAEGDVSQTISCGSDRTDGFPSLASLRDFLSQSLADPGSALRRRAEFFAGRPILGAAKELAVLSGESEVIPLQNCSNVTVSVGSISFGDQRINSSTTRYFTINNPNCCAVNYTISGGSYGFSLSSSGGTIPANGSVSISVTFTPYYEQSYNGSISISPGGAGVNFSGRGVR